MLEQNNARFLEKYGKVIEGINQNREKMINEYVNGPNSGKRSELSWDDPAKKLGIEGKFNWRSAYIDTSKILPPKSPEEFLPNVDTFLQGQAWKRSIPEIYDVSYNLKNYPKTYKFSTVSFDDIKIPEHDNFGIKSTLEKKQYKIVDRKILRENIDYINEYLDADNREINLTLLKEKEEIRKRRKASELLGKEFDEEEKKKEEKEKKSQQETDNNAKEATDEAMEKSENLESGDNL